MISCGLMPQFGAQAKGVCLVVWFRSVRIIAKFPIRFDCPRGLPGCSLKFCQELHTDLIYPDGYVPE